MDKKYYNEDGTYNYDLMKKDYQNYQNEIYNLRLKISKLKEQMTGNEYSNEYIGGKFISIGHKLDKYRIESRKLFDKIYDKL